MAFPFGKEDVRSRFRKLAPESSLQKTPKQELVQKDSYYGICW